MVHPFDLMLNRGRGVCMCVGGVRLTSRQISLKLTHNRLMVSANPQTKV